MVDITELLWARIHVGQDSLGNGMRLPLLLWIETIIPEPNANFYPFCVDLLLQIF